MWPRKNQNHQSQHAHRKKKIRTISPNTYIGRHNSIGSSWAVSSGGDDPGHCEVRHRAEPGTIARSLTVTTALLCLSDQSPQTPLSGTGTYGYVKVVQIQCACCYINIDSVCFTKHCPATDLHHSVSLVTCLKVMASLGQPVSKQCDLMTIAESTS